MLILQKHQMTINNDFAEVYLPESIQEMMSVIGLPAALTIVESRGGIRLCVPKYVSAEHWLAKAIGITAFKKLVEYYNGEEIDIPRCISALNAMKELEIYNRAIKNGDSGAVLAREYGYTERGIRKVKRRVEARLKIESDQQQLF